MKTKMFCLLAVLLFTGCACGRKMSKADVYKQAWQNSVKAQGDDEQTIATMHKVLAAWHKKLKEHHLI